MEVQLDSDGNPIVDQMSEEGFVDLTFRITELVNVDAHYRFHLVASYKQSELGVDVILVKGINGGFDPEMKLIKDHVYYKGVRFIRSGVESNRLVSAIAELYAVSTTPNAMVAEETFTAIALHQGDLNFETDCVRIKLFGKDGDPLEEEEYYESFFNVDFANRIVYWNEKDSDYRESLLRALSIA